MRFGTLLGALSGIEGNPTFGADLFLGGRFGLCCSNRISQSQTSNMHTLGSAMIIITRITLAYHGAFEHDVAESFRNMATVAAVAMDDPFGEGSPLRHCLAIDLVSKYPFSNAIAVYRAPEPPPTPKTIPWQRCLSQCARKGLDRFLGSIDFLVQILVLGGHFW